MDKCYIIVAIIILVSIIYLYHMQVLWQTQFVKRLQFTLASTFLSLSGLTHFTCRINLVDSKHRPTLR